LKKEESLNMGDEEIAQMITRNEEQACLIFWNIKTRMDRIEYKLKSALVRREVNIQQITLGHMCNKYGIQCTRSK
jgi:uncharacterized lipoprotein YehR (DUF1307 family)